MLNMLKKFVRDEEGQDLVEYAMLLSLVSIAAILGITAVGARVQALFAQVSTSF